MLHAGARSGQRAFAVSLVHIYEGVPQTRHSINALGDRRVNKCGLIVELGLRLRELEQVGTCTMYIVLSTST